MNFFQFLFLALSTILYCSHQVSAFNPRWLFVAGLDPTYWFTDVPGIGKPWSLYGWPHEGITVKAIDSLYGPYFGIQDPTSSMLRARSQIAEANAHVDSPHSEERKLPAAHFDGESFEEGQKRLISLRKSTITELRQGHGSKAREYLGRALHTLQDFYSHSNWVELDRRVVSDDLGRDKGAIYPRSPKDLKTCFACKDPVCNPSKLGETRGYCLEDAVFPSILGFATSFRRANNAAVNLCKVIGDSTAPQSILTLGCGKIAHTRAPYCRANLNPELKTGEILTTGYYGGEDQFDTPSTTFKKPLGKCSHGGPYDGDADGSEGIAKDSAWAYLSPHHYHHYEAARLAVDATVQFLEDIRFEICDGPNANPKREPSKCTELKLLYGVGPSLAFAIDTTGSMGNIIAAVRDQAIAIVNARRGTFDEPSLYILSEINDPSPAQAQTFTHADQFIQAILQLNAFGGDDCPEMAMTGLYNAILASDEGGIIFLWTDAGAKDYASQGPNVESAAQEKKVTVFPFLFPSECSSNKGFEAAASISGGQLFHADEIEAGGITKLADYLIRANHVQILYSKVTFPLKGVLRFLGLRRRGSGSSSATYEIPVDSTLTDIVFSLSASAADLTITRPDDSVIAESDTGVSAIKFSGGTILQVQNPATGTWRATVEGSKNFSLSVSGTSNLHFSSYDFVEFKGRSGHAGFFGLGRIPTPGANYTNLAVMNGEYNSVHFDFRSEEGERIAGFDLEPGAGEHESDTPKNYLAGNVTIPASPFYVYASGKDKSGASFMRVLPGVFDLSSNTNSTNSTSNSTTHRSVGLSSARLPPKTSLAGFLNSTTSTGPEATSFNTPVPCANCPRPCPKDASGNLKTVTRTIIYYASSLCSTKTTSGAHTITNYAYSTSRTTTTIHVPCPGECPSSLPDIEPIPNPPTPTEIITSILCPLGHPALPAGEPASKLASKVSSLPLPPPLYTGLSAGNFSGNGTNSTDLRGRRDVGLEIKHKG